MRCTLDGNGRKIVLPRSLTERSSSLISVGNFRTLTIRNAIIEGDVERFISLGTRSNIIYENVTFEKHDDDKPIATEGTKLSTSKQSTTGRMDVNDCVTACSVVVRDVELLVLDSDTTAERGKQ